MLRPLMEQMYGPEAVSEVGLEEMVKETKDDIYAAHAQQKRKRRSVGVYHVEVGPLTVGDLDYIYRSDPERAMVLQSLGLNDADELAKALEAAVVRRDQDPGADLLLRTVEQANIMPSHSESYFRAVPEQIQRLIP